jgi:branched-chain amino acid aminotransferase
MYLRPVLIGCNPQLGIASSTEVLFAVMCAPVGSYSGAASLSPGTAVIARNYDRAAPNGTGAFKLSANYATSLHPYNMAHRQGYRELLFLDPATKTHIDEFGSSNFLAIKGNSYVTPLSDSVLPSITNKSLQAVAEDFGLKVEKRRVPVEELAEFDEVNACGTAVVITPICSVDDKARLEDSEVVKTWRFGSPDKCGAVSEKLYKRLRGIQDGLEEDTHGWCLYL